MLLSYVVCDNNYSNINQILKNEFKISSRLFQKLIKQQCVYCNNLTVDTRNSVKIGDIITIKLDYEEENDNIVATNMNLDILYEDNAFLVVNKPAGIAVHPSMAHYDDSLSNGIKYYFNKIELHKKIRPVNRLDFDTSGIVFFAKNEYIQECLIKQMHDNVFQKEYLAIVEGYFKNKHDIINLPIARKDNSIIERFVSENGQVSVTEYEVLEELNNMSLIKCTLKTGRTHQIRVHMSAIGHPLIGDTLYGNPSSLINRQALHSYKVSFIHPVTHEFLSLTCELPHDMKNASMFNT